jgi:phage terminase large subunit-like protein
MAKVSSYVKKGERFVTEALAGDLEIKEEFLQKKINEHMENRINGKARGYCLDNSENGLAHRVCWAVENLGFELEPWQVFMLMSLFGWKKSEVKNGNLG